MKVRSFNENEADIE